MPSCPSCGVPVAPDARFCSACGAALEDEVTHEGRKLETVLFADLVGSTALASSGIARRRGRCSPGLWLPPALVRESRPPFVSLEGELDQAVEELRIGDA